MTVQHRRVLGAVAGISALAGCLARSSDTAEDKRIDVTVIYKAKGRDVS